MVFIDGIDIRPSAITYPEYLDCIKGLANAVWEINNDFFPSIRDSPGRLRAVILIRPDIFASLGIQNQNTKIRDNAVLLKWNTPYRDHRSSELFAVSDRLLAYDQSKKLNLKPLEAWDYYFPYDTPNIEVQFENPSSFIGFLRFSLYRPRDIVTMLTMLKERFVANSRDQSRSFTVKDFEDSVFRRNYADYLLGEVKDQLSFYYSSQDYEMFLKFFEYLEGKTRFNHDEYLVAFNGHVQFMDDAKMERPKFMGTNQEFLQFLYELNVICYIEKAEFHRPFIHWCFIERTYSNISPKIKIDKDYEIFPGMAKALNTGKLFKKRR